MRVAGKIAMWGEGGGGSSGKARQGSQYNIFWSLKSNQAQSTIVCTTESCLI